MNIKGKATIQLFDKDNNLVHESVEENLITDAVKRIVMLDEKGFFKGHRRNSNNNMYLHLTQVTPFAKQLLGGILLFGNEIDEDASTIFPPIGSTPIGHAGGSYAGSNVYRGSYNSTESGLLYSGTAEVGYRHVWDFATDKANGTISCICLTSTVGGNTGWISRGLAPTGSDTTKYDPDSCIEAFLCAGGSSSLRPFTTPSNNGGLSVIGNLFSQNIYYRILYVDEVTGTVYYALPHSSMYPGVIGKSTFSPSLTLSLFTDVNNHVAPDISNHIVMNKTSSEFNYNGFFEIDRESGNVTMTFASNSTTLAREVWSPVSGLVSRETVSLAGSGATIASPSDPPIPPFYYKGNYYAYVSTSAGVRLIEVSPDGEILQSFDWSAMSGRAWRVTYSAELDRIIIRSTYNYSGNEGVLVIFDGSSLIPFRTAEGTSEARGEVGCSNPTAPGSYLSPVPSYVGGSKDLFYKFFTNYLGSINNLASPVTKTAATTMKITYDIYTE